MRSQCLRGRMTPMLRLWLVITPILPIVLAPPGTDLLPLVLNLAVCIAAAIGFALSGVFYFRRGDERLDLVLGAWLVISPWVLGFTWSRVATWHAVACGLVIAGKALLAACRSRSGGPPER